MIEHLGIILLALHMIGDFILQTDWIAANKLEEAEPWFVHILIHFALYVGILGPLFGIRGLAIAIFVGSAHGIIDIDRWVEPKDGFEQYPFWFDQILHVSSIALTIMLLG